MRKKECKAKPILIIFTLIIVFVLCILVVIFSKPPIAYNTAIIYVDGLILTKPDEISYSEATYSDTIIEQIDNILKDKNIKAIILEINSPGGSAVASSEIADAIKKAKKEKLTVALIREQGTSGAYWIASACDYIISHPLAITGSIGVITSYLEISGLLERLNITYERFVGGRYKDTMSPFRDLTEEEREMIQKKIDTIYDIFVREVMENRNLSKDKMEKIATGMFYLGSEAKELGLVDELGTKKDVIRYIESKLNIKVKIKEYKKRASLFDIFSRVEANYAFWVGRGIVTGFIEKNLISAPRT